MIFYAYLVLAAAVFLLCFLVQRAVSASRDAAEAADETAMRLESVELQVVDLQQDVLAAVSQLPKKRTKKAKPNTKDLPSDEAIGG